jgi:hypothetical protein
MSMLLWKHNRIYEIQPGKLVLHWVDFVNKGREKPVAQCRSLSFDPTKFFAKVDKMPKANLFRCHLAGIR